MTALFKNPLALLFTSFVMFLVAVPLVSIGTTRGPGSLLWIGLVALFIGALIPTVQRLVGGGDSESEDDQLADRNSEKTRNGKKV